MAVSTLPLTVQGILHGARQQWEEERDGTPPFAWLLTRKTYLDLTLL
jgi:hypothetical protein